MVEQEQKPEKNSLCIPQPSFEKKESFILHLIQHKRQKTIWQTNSSSIKNGSFSFLFLWISIYIPASDQSINRGIFMDNDLKTHGVYVEQSLTIQAFKLKDLFQPLFLSSYWLAKGFAKVRKLGMCWRLSYTKIKNKIKETKMYVPFFS